MIIDSPVNHLYAVKFIELISCLNDLQIFAQMSKQALNYIALTKAHQLHVLTAQHILVVTKRSIAHAKLHPTVSPYISKLYSKFLLSPIWTAAIALADNDVLIH